MQIHGLSHILKLSTPHPNQALVSKEQMYEIDHRKSRHISHVRKEKRGWKPCKHEVQKSRQKGHMQNRGMTHKFGDARAARAEL
jgi:hypothetical protein